MVRTLRRGDPVLTPAGPGRIAKPQNGLYVKVQEYRSFFAGGSPVSVYSVLLDDGELRYYSYEALARLNPHLSTG